MRARDEMLVDVLESRRSYAWLMQAEDMLVIRLAMDATDLLETLAEKDAEIERLKAAAERFSRKIAGLPE